MYTNKGVTQYGNTIGKASELATEIFDELQSPRCTAFAISIATAKLPAWSRHVRAYYAINNMASNI